MVVGIKVGAPTQYREEALASVADQDTLELVLTDWNLT
jgi:hypothetical protein